MVVLSLSPEWIHAVALVLTVCVWVSEVGSRRYPCTNTKNNTSLVLSVISDGGMTGDTKTKSNW